MFKRSLGGGKKKISKSLLLLLVPLISLTAFVILLILLIISFLFLETESRKEISNSRPKTRNYYHLVEYTPNSNISSIRMVKLSRKLKKNEYISYRNSENHFFIISTILSPEKIECTGSCYCENERRVFPSVAKPMKYVFFGLTLVIAVGTFYDRVLQECEEYAKEEEGCGFNKENVNTIVENCEIVDKEKPDVEESRFYSCKGHCLPTLDYKSVSIRSDALKFGCKKHSTENEIHLVARKRPGERSINNFYHSSLAQEIFLNEYLTAFCRRTGKVLNYRLNDLKHTDEPGETLYLCYGSNEANKGNIDCQLSHSEIIDPKSDSK